MSKLVIDENRFNFCIKIGRQIWTAIKMIRYYADINFAFKDRDISSLENVNDTPRSLISMSGISRRHWNNGDRTFRRRNIKNDLCELFSCFCGMFFINATNFDNFSKFCEYYDDLLYTDEIMKKWFLATNEFIPLEINVTSGIKIKSRNGKLDRTRHPLIEALYFSDEIVDFCRKFSSDLIGSTTAMHSILFEGCRCFPNHQRYMDYGDSSRLKKLTNCKTRSDLNLMRCFSVFR